MNKLKWGVSVMIREAHDRINEWIDYHLALGCERIHVYDNDDQNPHLEILKGYIVDGKVVYTQWFDGTQNCPKKRLQAESYNHALQTVKEEESLDWLTFIDDDEFISPPENCTIAEYLAKWGRITFVEMPWQCYNANGLIEHAEGQGVVETYTQTCDKPSCQLYDFKSFANVAKTPAFLHVHYGVVGLARLSKHQSEMKVNHYICRSWEDWKAKINRGNITMTLYDDGEKTGIAVGSKAVEHFFEMNPDMREAVYAHEGWEMGDEQ